MSDALDRALADLMGRHPVSAMASATRQLMTGYLPSATGPTPVLATAVQAAAYAAYRMPATYAAVRAALTRASALLPEWSPRSLVDVGGGTGAAVWAATEVLPTLTERTVLDRSIEALRLGRELAGPAQAGVRWTQLDLAGALLPTADLVTAAYVLAELTPEVSADLVRAMSAAGATVVIVEPGTPAGYARILAARDQLIDAGYSVVAPCPHEAGCPLVAGQDWCHFSVRLDRSALHRRLKDGTQGYEDEKFSYVVASRVAAGSAGGRVLRHPVKRKGLVQLEVCREEGDARREVVTKGQGAQRYRAARDLAWGEAWPPVDAR